jgi:type IV secretory pathway VirB2 component (pilin)
MRTFALLCLFLIQSAAHAQASAPSWLEEQLFGHGKGNVVVAVVAVILVGLFTWMFAMDRRLRRLEKGGK